MNYILSKDYSSFLKCFEDDNIDLKALRKTILQDIETTRQETQELNEREIFAIGSSLSSLENYKVDLEQEL